MFRRLPGTFSRPLAAPLRAASHARIPPSAVSGARANSTHARGTTHTGRWIGSSLVIGTVGLVAAIYYYDSRSIAHEHVVMPVVRAVADPEQGHKLAVAVLSAPSWARPKDMTKDGPELHAELMGMPLDNPVGIAAGFDKDARCIDGLFDIGFGYVEVGSVTPQPQPGNPQPRFFRLEEDDAAINRYGFNSQGHGQALAQLRKRLVEFSKANPSLFPSPLPASPLPPADLPRSLRPGHILAVNLGKNKTSPADSDEDYIRGVRTLGPYADVVVINISSPNTPGLRALQSREPLERLLGDVVAERNQIAVNGLPKIAVKVTCDLSEEELEDVASAVRKTGVDGVIVSNTTIRREGLGLESGESQSDHQAGHVFLPKLTPDNAAETGGLSGRPLFPFALNALKTLRPLLPPSVPIIGAGGIWDGADALAMCRAGASTVQVYTAFGYRGVGTPRLLKDEITTLLDPGSSWAGQVGTDYVGANMGWDESRVASEGARLRAEAAELGNVLSEIQEKTEISQLAAEADEALAHLAAMNAATLSADGTSLPADAVLGLVHPADHAAAPAPAVAAPSVVVETPQGETKRIEAPAPPGPVPAEGAVVVAAGSAAPPAVIVETEVVPLRKPAKEKWAEEVHSGNRRLV